MACVPLGCDAARFRRVAPLLREPRPAVLVLGRLDPVKGHQPVMRLMAQVLRDWRGPGPKPYLHIVGLPANLSVMHLREMVESEGLRLDEDVRITAERVVDVARLLSEAAVGVVPSVGSEIICRVAEEFLLCGTPVVVSGVGSLDEVLFSPSAGVSYRGLPTAAAAALLRDWTERSLAEPEADKARRAAAAASVFSLESMGRRLQKSLEGC